jgi:hypothetical protein
MKLAIPQVQDCVNGMTETLIRQKILYPYRLLDKYFVVAIDGTGVLVFQERHCPFCLTKTHDGKTLYYHNVLEAKLVTPNDFAFFYITGGNFFIRPEIISQGSSMKPPRTTFSPIATFHR